LDRLNPPVLRPLVWLGNSKKNLRDFPDGAQKLLGDELQLIQFGGMPRDAKPFKGVGSGVLEIALRYASDAYRVVLALQLGKRIYVLHAFQKKSKKGIATPKREIDLIKQRYAEAQELAMPTKKRKPIEFETGSGNVFADLGLKDADQLLARSQIGFHVYKILEDKKLKQREIAAVLGIAQPDVSHLMNGHFSRFTTDKLLDFLKRLNRKVTIEVSRRHKGEPYQQVTFAP
jgi:phage-related protein/predicted XRE-type DNA-binding protein